MEELGVADLIAMVRALPSQMNSMREMYEARIAELEAENAALRTRVADLEAQLRTNSQNSSKPPSTDGPGQPATRSLRKPSKRKPGGQDGHRGQTLAQVSDPDVVIRHEPTCCRGCGSDLTGAAEVNCSRRQVFDIPPIKVHVTEHQIISRRCPCGKTTTGLAPAQAAAPMQYGPVMCAVIIYLFMGQFLSKKRTAQAIGELFGVPVSDGTVAAVTARATGDLTEFLAQVNARIKASLVAHFDETGLRCEGRNHWLHSASTPRYSRLFFHRKRGTEAMNSKGILPGFAGTAVHDAWSPYDTYTAAGHALCNSHLSPRAPGRHRSPRHHRHSRRLVLGRPGRPCPACAPSRRGRDPGTTRRCRHHRETHDADPARPPRRDSPGRRPGPQTPSPGPAHPQTGDRLPEIRPQPGDTVHEQLRRTRNPYDEDPTESIRHHAHRERSRTLRRPSFLPANHRETRHASARSPDPADQQKPLAARLPLTSYLLGYKVIAIQRYLAGFNVGDPDDSIAGPT